MNLKQLQYFCEVAAAGSIAHAAQRLSVVPTAISMSVSQLEAALGGLLFDRSMRPMPLTTLGHFVLPRAKELVAQALQLERDAREVAAARGDWLGIGFTAMSMLSVLPMAIRIFCAHHAEVKLEMMQLPPEQQPEAIQAGRIHLGLSLRMAPMEPLPGLTSLPLLAGSPLVALPAGDARLSRPSVHIEELSGTPFIMYPRTHRIRYVEQVRAHVAALGVALDAGIETEGLHSALGLVAGGLGFTFVDAWIARNMARPDVAFLPLEGFETRSILTVLYPEGTLGTLPQAFLADLQRAIGLLAEPTSASVDHIHLSL